MTAVVHDRLDASRSSGLFPKDPDSTPSERPTPYSVSAGAPAPMAWADHRCGSARHTAMCPPGSRSA
eukprot:7738937-Alexandrium_andersonii.AAC.1